MSPASRAVGATVAGGALFGTAGTAAVLFERAEPSALVPPLAIGAARLGIGGLALLAAGLLVHRHRAPFARVLRSRVTPVAAACVALYQVCFFGGVSSAGVALATLVAVGSAPVCTGILAAIALRERATGGWIMATGVCVAGLALATLGSRAEESAGATNPVAGAVLALGAGVAIAGYTVCAKHLLAAGTDGLAYMSVTYLLAWLLLAPFVLTGPMSWLTRSSGLALAAYLGLATMALANVAYLRGVSHLSAGPVATLALTDPVVATMLGVLVLGERPTLLSWCGFALVAAGLVWQGLQQSGATPALPAQLSQR